MNTSSELTLQSYLLALLPPLLVLGLAQCLFEVASDPPMTGVSTALKRLTHQNNALTDLWILEEARGRYAWLAMVLLSFVAFMYGAMAGINIILRSHFRDRLPLLISMGTILIGMGVLWLWYQMYFEAAMYRLIYGFTFRTFSQSNLFDPQFLVKVKFILLILNTFAVIVPAIIVLAASSVLAIPTEEWRPSLPIIASHMNQLRTILNLGSLVLVGGILHMHAWLQWPAALIQDTHVQLAVSKTALAITVFWGTCFTLMLLATYGPAATKLSAQARQLLNQEQPNEPIQNRQAWLKEHDLSITLGEQLPQIGIMLAPVLAGPLGSLLMGTH